MHGKTGFSSRNTNGTAHSSGKFPEERNTFQDIALFPFLPKRPKFSVPFVWITSARLSLEKEGNPSPRGTWCLQKVQLNAIPFFGSEIKKTSHMSVFFAEISVQMVSTPGLGLGNFMLCNYHPT